MEKVKFEKIKDSEDDWLCIGTIYEKTSQEEKEVFGVDIKKKGEYSFSIYKTTFEDCDDYFYRFLYDENPFIPRSINFKSLEEAKKYAIKKFERIKPKI
jgi:hypothetical protein